MSPYEHQTPGPTTRMNQSRPLVPIARISGAEYAAVTKPLLKDHDERWGLNDANYEALVRAMVKIAKKQTPGETVEYVVIQNRPNGFAFERNLPIEVDGRHYFLEWSGTTGYMVLYTHQVHTEMPKAHDRKRMTSALAEATRNILLQPAWDIEPGKYLSPYKPEFLHQQFKQEEIARNRLVDATQNLASRNCASALKKWAATLDNLAPLKMTQNRRQRVERLVNGLDIARSDLMTRIDEAYTPTLDGALVQLKAIFIDDLENNLEIDPDDVREFCVLTDNGRLIGDPSLPAELLSWGHAVIPVPDAEKEDTECNRGKAALDQMARKQTELAEATEKFLRGRYMDLP